MPIPLVLTARIRISQKIMLCALFSSGIFVMVAAFLRAYYSVKNISTLAIALGWASREALVSVFTVSAPGVKPLITQSKWFRSSRGGTSGYGYYYSSGSARHPGYEHGSRSGGGRRKDTVGSSSLSSAARKLQASGSGQRPDLWTVDTACERETHPYELSSSLGWNKKEKRESATESQEHIIDHEGSSSPPPPPDKAIRVTTDMMLTEEARRGP